MIEVDSSLIRIIWKIYWTDQNSIEFGEQTNVLKDDHLYIFDYRGDKEYFRLGTYKDDKIFVSFLDWAPTDLPDPCPKILKMREANISFYDILNFMEL